jgi:hypothetical protein
MNRNYINDGCDYFNKPIKVGDKIIRFVCESLNVTLEEREVVKVDEYIYLAPFTKHGGYGRSKGSRNSRLLYSGRCIIIPSQTTVWQDFKSLLQRIYNAVRSY